MRKHHKYIDLNTFCIAFIFIFYSRIHSITFSVACQMLAGVVVGFFFSPQFFFQKQFFLLLLAFIVIYCKKIIKMLTLWLVRGLEGLLASFSCNSITSCNIEKKFFFIFS